MRPTSTLELCLFKTTLHFLTLFLSYNQAPLLMSIPFLLLSLALPPSNIQPLLLILLLNCFLFQFSKYKPSRRGRERERIFSIYNDRKRDICRNNLFQTYNLHSALSCPSNIPLPAIVNTQKKISLSSPF